MKIALSKGSLFIRNMNFEGFSGGSDGKESTCNAGDLDSIPGFGRCPGERNGYPLQYSCLKNPMDRGAWQATVCGVTRVGHNLVTKPPESVDVRHLLFSGFVLQV